MVVNIQSSANKGWTAMKPQEVTDALKLSQLKDKIWYVVPSCATTGEGLLEGLVRSLCLQSVIFDY